MRNLPLNCLSTQYCYCACTGRQPTIQVCSGSSYALVFVVGMLRLTIGWRPLPRQWRLYSRTPWHVLHPTRLFRNIECVCSHISQNVPSLIMDSRRSLPRSVEASQDSSDCKVNVTAQTCLPKKKKQQISSRHNRNISSDSCLRRRRLELKTLVASVLLLSTLAVSKDAFSYRFSCILGSVS